MLWSDPAAFDTRTEELFHLLTLLAAADDLSYHCLRLGTVLAGTL